jgi:hypothetical protein
LIGWICPIGYQILPVSSDHIITQVAIHPDLTEFNHEEHEGYEVFILHDLHALHG